MWNVTSYPGSVREVKYVLGLLPGLEDYSLVGYVYNIVVAQKSIAFVVMTHPNYGTILHSPEHDMFWQAGMSSRANLKNMPFGTVSESGLIVPGTQADETTLEAGFALLNRAPYGARKRLKEFFS